MNDGGPAFPGLDSLANSEDDYNDRATYTAYGTSGMSLRDWFAGQALTASAMHYPMKANDAARHAYQMADAMLAEREKA
jgi:hypothetical protein